MSSTWPTKTSKKWKIICHFLTSCTQKKNVQIDQIIVKKLTWSSLKLPLLRQNLNFFLCCVMNPPKIQLTVSLIWWACLICNWNFFQWTQKMRIGWNFFRLEIRVCGYCIGLNAHLQVIFTIESEIWIRLYKDFWDFDWHEVIQRYSRSIFDAIFWKAIDLSVE